MMRSRIRYSTIGQQIVIHSRYPTTDHNSVFFGPDTYRFINLLRRTLGWGGRLLEIGAGTGAAALALADRFTDIVMTDINPLAISYARINAALSGCERIETRCTDLADGIDGKFQAIIANPPYLIDPHGPWYRDGGHLGIDCALRFVHAALPLLDHAGCLVLYTGSPIVNGKDLLAEALVPLLLPLNLPAHYDEIDVDIFGSSLGESSYSLIDRIAVVALVVGQPGTTWPAQRSPMRGLEEPMTPHSPSSGRVHP
jgi:SAM-dependent methyltransferase